MEKAKDATRPNPNPSLIPKPIPNHTCNHDLNRDPSPNPISAWVRWSGGTFAPSQPTVTEFDPRIGHVKVLS